MVNLSAEDEFNFLGLSLLVLSAYVTTDPRRASVTRRRVQSMLGLIVLFTYTHPFWEQCHGT